MIGGDKAIFNKIEPLFKAIADGAWGETNVTCDNGNRSQDWTFVPSGYEITMDEVE